METISLRPACHGGGTSERRSEAFRRGVVRHHRKAQGYSQESFADASGLHRTYIGAIERGERNVSIDNIARIAEALGLQIGELFQRIDGPPV